MVFEITDLLTKAKYTSDRNDRLICVKSKNKFFS